MSAQGALTQICPEHANLSGMTNLRDNPHLSSFPVINPATGEVIEHVANMGPQEAQLAIDRAQAALPAWRSKTGKERSIILRRWH